MITGNPIEMERYSWHEDNAVWKYLNDAELGGGPLRDQMLGAMTPGQRIWSEMLERLQLFYMHQDGQEWAGGYFHFPNVQLNPTDDTMFVDIWVFASERGMDHDIMQMALQHNSTEAQKCCFNEVTDPEQGVDIAGLMNGLVRFVLYQYAPATGVRDVRGVYEGEFYDSKPNGFGRLVFEQDGVPMLHLGYSSDFFVGGGNYFFFKNYVRKF